MDSDEFYKRLAAANIRYRNAADPKFAYGVSASRNPQPFNSIVLHHATGNTDDLVKYGQRIDPQRGGAFGYHFYIDPNGEIVQGAPFDKRTNHIEPTSGPNRLPGSPDISNSSALGISLVNGHRGYTPEQKAALERFIPLVQQQFGIDPRFIYGHGELQSNRMNTEGMYSRYFREGQPLPDPETPLSPPSGRSMIAYAGMKNQAPQQTTPILPQQVVVAPQRQETQQRQEAPQRQEDPVYRNDFGTTARYYGNKLFPDQIDAPTPLTADEQKTQVADMAQSAGYAKAAGGLLNLAKLLQEKPEPEQEMMPMPMPERRRVAFRPLAPMRGLL